jgi:helix-turn-helix protein
MPQAAVSRIERGVVSPSVDTLDRLLRGCGKELEAVERPWYDVDRSLIRDRLRLTPGERVRLAELEWRKTEPFRRAGKRARRA